MNEATMNKLEYTKIRGRVADMTISPAGRKLAETMKPSTDFGQVKAWLIETDEASELLASGASIPLSAMEGIDSLMALLGKGKIYNEQELEQLKVWLTSIAQMKRYMSGKRQIAPTLAGYADSMFDCPKLREELERCIRYGILTDEASPDLAYIRRHIYAAEDKIQKRVEQTLGKYRSSLQESIVSRRSGRFVLSVKREYRKSVPGTVLDESASGQTLFIEPVEVAELQGELQQWKAAEERERTVVLSQLSELAGQYEPEMKTNMQAMAIFDFITARAKLSRSCGGQQIEMVRQSVIRLIGAKHPLLGEGAVPLDAELGLRWKQLIITGPNTGGKTITLKTIGLLAMMAQSGLRFAAEEGSVMGMFRHIIADVGDGQSLEQSLSTFSSHITVLKEMLSAAGPSSLLLLDEIAAGTDPSEGIALSIAVLETLLQKGALAAATTHFNEIKTFAARTPGCQNGKMAFDQLSLKPLYRLEIGEAGDSHAFAIARRFGLPEQVMLRAEQLLVRKDGGAAANGVNAGMKDSQENEPESAGNSDSGSGHTVDSRLQSGNTAGDRPESGQLSGKAAAVEPAQTAGVSLEADSPPIAVEDGKTRVRRKFEQGDAVWIYPLKRAGIVYRPADERGMVVVQVKGEKLTFNQKRLKPYIAREKLYPGQDYDLDIVFESKANRKARHTMERKHVEGLQVILPAEEQRD